MVTVPYRLAPDSPELVPLAGKHAATWALVNHKGVPAIYPPTAQFLFFANAALFGGSLLGWKLILVLFDGLLVAGLFTILRRNSCGLMGLIGVLWCPLLILECYEGGHLDLIGAALVVLALAALGRGWWFVAGIALGLAINVKYLWPVLLLILLTRKAAEIQRGTAFVVVALLVAAVGWLPYLGDLGAALATARMFAESWTFNDVIFEQLRRLPGPRWLPMALVLAVSSLLAVLLALRQPRDVWRDAWLITGAALLLGPVAYPWYFLWIVPGLALRAAGMVGCLGVERSCAAHR